MRARPKFEPYTCCTSHALVLSRTASWSRNKKHGVIASPRLCEQPWYIDGDGSPDVDVIGRRMIISYLEGKAIMGSCESQLQGSCPHDVCSEHAIISIDTSGTCQMKVSQTGSTHNDTLHISWINDGGGNNRHCYHGKGWECDNWENGSNICYCNGTK